MVVVTVMMMTTESRRGVGRAAAEGGGEPVVVCEGSVVTERGRRGGATATRIHAVQGRERGTGSGSTGTVRSLWHDAGGSVALERVGGRGQIEHVRGKVWVRVRPRQRHALTFVLHATILKPDLLVGEKLKW